MKVLTLVTNLQAAILLGLALETATQEGESRADILLQDDMKMNEKTNNFKIITLPLDCLRKSEPVKKKLFAYNPFEGFKEYVARNICIDCSSCGFVRGKGH